MLLDTHVVVWLHTGRTDQFSPEVVERLEAEALRVSPPALLEIDYLHEIGRLATGSESVFAHLGRTIGLQVADESAASLFRRAASQTWTRDPFDRLIATHAVMRQEPLLTRDALVLEHCPVAEWPGDRD